MPKLILARLCAVVLIACGASLTPAAAQDGSVTYRVVKGDTLYGIAKKYLKSQSAAREIQRINRVRNPRRMPVNKRLSIPRRLLKTAPVRVRVAAWSGPVTIGGRRPKNGDILGKNQRIVTGRNGFIAFSTSYDGRFSIPSNSSAKLNFAHRYVMNNILDVDFEIQNGRGRATSPTLKQQERLRMRTPVATTAVRGTEFRMAHSTEDGSSQTEVIEGTVGVAAGEAESAIPAGFGAASSVSGVGQQEALLPEPEFVDPGSTQTGEELKFELVPQADAKAYRVQLARGSGFVDIISEQIVSGTEATFDGLDDARYAVRARSISESGLEGFDSDDYSFLRKKLGVSASPPSPLADGFLFEWLADGAGTSTFAFQLWSKENPSELVIDETGLTKPALLLTDLEPGTYSWRVAVMQVAELRENEVGLLKIWGDTTDLVVSE